MKSFRLEVLVAVREQRDALAEKMVRQIEQEMPEYAAVSRSIRMDIQRAIRGVVVIGFDALIEERLLSEAELQTIGSIGARRSHQGLALETFLSAVGVAIGVGADWTLSYATGLPTPDEVEAREGIADLARDFLDLNEQVKKAIMAGYIESQARKISKHSDQSALFKELFLGSSESEDDDDIVSRAAATGYNFRLPQRLIVLTDKNDSLRSLQKAGETFCGEIPTAIEAKITQTSHPHSVLIVAPEVWLRAVETIKRVAENFPVRALLCDEATGPSQVLTMYREAQDLVRLALKVEELDSVVEADSLLPDWVLDWIPSDVRSRFVEKVLGPLLRDVDGPLLMKELTARFKGETQPTTARRLGVTPRSLRRHLARIRELTQLDPCIPAEAFRLELATRLSKLSSDGQR
jgi:PucR-like helix-turn-helix protein